jgi:hypothetical protein
MIVTQALIAVCGVAAVALSQDRRENWRRWSCIFGLAGQPAWLVETICAHQWGIAALCIVYTWSWGRGLRFYWIKGEGA